ncbi:MAG: hypothetical protein WBD07_18005 [Vicinamibacterales bacterium]
MSTWSEVFLGVIAAATLATAIAQIGIFVAAGLLARRLDRLSKEIHVELRPIFGHLDAIGRDASRATALAAAQVERIDGVCTDLVQRIEEAAGAFQAGLAAPVREGRAMLSGLRAAFEAIRELRGNARPRRGRDDEDALFI